MLKSRLVFVLFLMNIVNTFGVQVVDKSQTNAGGQTVAALLVTVFVIFVLFIIGVGICILIIIGLVKLYSKLSDYNRGKKDFLYYSARQEMDQCHIFRDYEMKKRNWKRFWLAWKRQIIYIDNGKKLIPVGEYNGEMIKKQDYFLIGLYNKLSFFKYTESLIILPYNFKDEIIRKEYIGKTKSLIIKCEGLDTLGTMPYYHIVLIRYDKHSKTFLDYTDKIYKDYVSNIVHTDIIKDQLLDTREMVKKAVDSNPYISLSRKKE